MVVEVAEEGVALVGRRGVRRRRQEQQGLGPGGGERTGRVDPADALADEVGRRAAGPQRQRLGQGHQVALADEGERGGDQPAVVLDELVDVGGAVGGDPLEQRRHHVAVGQRHRAVGKIALPHPATVGGGLAALGVQRALGARQDLGHRRLDARLETEALGVGRAEAGRSPGRARQLVQERGQGLERGRRLRSRRRQALPVGLFARPREALAVEAGRPPDLAGRHLGVLGSDARWAARGQGLARLPGEPRDAAGPRRRRRQPALPRHVFAHQQQNRGVRQDPRPEEGVAAGAVEHVVVEHHPAGPRPEEGEVQAVVFRQAGGGERRLRPFHRPPVEVHPGGEPRRREVFQLGVARVPAGRGGAARIDLEPALEILDHQRRRLELEPFWRARGEGDPGQGRREGEDQRAARAQGGAGLHGVFLRRFFLSRTSCRPPGSRSRPKTGPRGPG